MTHAEFWIDQCGSGVWRVARRTLECCHKPRHHIAPGERYLDTGERYDGPWATLKMCAMHANEKTEA